MHEVPAMHDKDYMVGRKKEVNSVVVHGEHSFSEKVVDSLNVACFLK